MTGSYSQGARGTRHPGIVVAVLAVMLSLLGPALAAAAQDNPPATPAILDTQEADGTLRNDPVTTTAEATVESSETATVEATDEATEDGAATADRRIMTLVGTGTVVVEQHTCSVAVTDPELVPYIDLSTTLCLESIAPVSFTVSDGAGYTSTLAASPTSWGQVATFADVPATTITITQAVPPGYENPVVFCREVGTAAPGSFALQPVSGSSVTWPLVAGSEVHCAFFSEPTGEDDGGGDTDGSELNIVVKRCPVGFDLATDAVSDCVDTEDGVPFAVSGPSGSFTETTGDAVPGGVSFAGLAPGDYGITMTVPADAASVFAWACTKVGVPAEAPAAPLATGASLTLTVDEGVDYLCQWYIVPGDGGDEPGPTGSVRVSKYTCPVGVAPSDDDYALSEQCRETIDPVSFEVSDSAGADFPLTLDPGVPQTGDVSGLAFGTIWIAEIVPDGYGEPRVFCSDTPSDGAGNYAPVPVMGGNAVEVELRADAEMPLTCLFFNFPGGDDDGGTGIVHVSKYTCPAGVEWSDDDYLLSEQCRETIDPVSFTLIATAGGYEQTVVADAGVPQSATFAGVPFGEIAIEESVPPGYGHPLVFCADTAADGPGAYEPVAPWPESGAFIIEHRADAEIDLSCIFFNFPDGDDSSNTVTVNKYVCPSWVNPETDALLDACVSGGDGIPFALVDGNGRHPAPISGGSVTWADVVIGAEGELQIIEDIPTGYSDPWVVCDGILMASANGFVVPNPGEARPFHVECDWFNFALEDAALAVVKHTCAPGYDLHGAGADPMADCPELIDGVDFRIAGMGADMTSTTGDAGSGMVQFGGLDPGGYTITETVPGGTATSFVLDCYGNDLGAVRPYPLATGQTLDLTLHAGEVVTCHWFNVPAVEGGKLTVIKYICAGEAFVSDLECEIHEDGVTFDLAIRQDGAWGTVATATTDNHGRIAWTGLEPGRYWLGEHGDEWCNLTSDQLNDDRTGIIVEDGEPAIVKVYNCGAEPGKPGETPTKFPDTGVPPAGAGSSGGDSLPAAALAGLLALPMSRRRLVALATALPAAGVMGRALAQDGDQVIEPIDGTAGAAVAPASLCLPSSGDSCERGPVPAHLRIDAIGVDAPIEILETVAGEMQQPTDETHVAWYKETARLGETGNMLLAGHLNWWGVPEAVFYNLATLVAGDEIVAADAEGKRWVYAVEWVRQVPGGEEPGEGMLGMTSWPAVTLITCGGAWDSAASEYDQRTVVRANLVEPA